MTTTFQDRLRGIVEASLRQKGICPVVNIVPVTRLYRVNQAPGTVYIEYIFDYRGHAYKVYIYDDDAGFFLDGRWRISERGAFDSEEELIRAFTENLNKALES